MNGHKLNLLKLKIACSLLICFFCPDFDINSLQSISLAYAQKSVKGNDLDGKKMMDVMRKEDKHTNQSSNSRLGWFRKYESVATWVIALIAIVGFIASYASSRKTSKALRIALDTFTTPLVTIKSVTLGRPMGEPVSCESPPNQMILIYHNPKDIPAQIHEQDSTIWWGDEELKPTESRGESSNDTTETILTKGQEGFFYYVLRKDIVEHLSSSDDYWKPPFLKIRFEIIYSSVNSDQRYKYTSTKTMGFDCKRSQVRVQAEEEISKPI